MASQLWSQSEDGGYFYSPELSKFLRARLQPITRFRQFADAQDASQFGKHRGTKFFWNIHDDLEDHGGKLDETQSIPETNFKLRQNFLEVNEYGVAVPFTEKLDTVAKQRVKTVIDRNLKMSARKVIDVEVYNEFDRTPLRVVPTNGNDAEALTITEDGTCAETNNIALGKKHVASVVTIMKERSIPGFSGDSYVCLTNPGNLDSLRNELEGVYQHTESGVTRIFHGEVGRYREMRFVEQSFIPTGGAQDSDIFKPLTRKSDPWDNAKSSWCFFFGSDTVMEGIITPEQIRAQIGQDFGRQRAIAWYGMFGFGLARTDPIDATVMKWDSAA